MPISRRFFLKIGLSAGAGLLVGCSRTPAPTPSATPQAGVLPDGSFAPGAWVQIDPDETVTVFAHKSEMGQGIHTALAMLAAEELDADWALVRVVQAGAGGELNQLTDGSTSLEEMFPLVRQAAASARLMLVAAAASVLGADPVALRTEAGAVVDPSGRRLSYGRLAGAAALQQPPDPGAVSLKPRAAMRLVGTPTLRLDAPAKLDGSAVFGMDVRLPGMLYAVAAFPSSFGATLGAYDAAAALAVPGVRQVTPFGNAVAVVAETTWAAMRGRAALNAVWEPGPDGALDSSALEAALVAALEAPLARVAGDPAQGAVAVVEAVYQLPFRAHAPLEPTSYTAAVSAAGAEIWAPAQDPQGARRLVAGALGLAPDAVTLHTTYLGGAFGRRLRHDGVAEVALLARAAGVPVKLVFTREDELRHSFYHPASVHSLRAELSADGAPLSWRHAFAAGFTAYNFQLGVTPPYRIPTCSASGALAPSAVPQGWWRGVDYVQTIFAAECFLDEIAAATQRDPLELRRALLDDERLRAVLDLAAAKAGWGEPLPSGRGRGVALCAFNGTRVAEVAEVAAGADGALRVERVVVAVDCGLAVNPLGVAAQVEGSVAFALTSVLKAAPEIAGGAVVQGNFDGLPLLRLDEMPAVEVHLIEGDATPSGMGEPAVPPLAPAVLNAIFAATGKRLRRLPLD